MSAGARLSLLRGNAPARSHNARTIAALASNPGCTRRALLDAAGIDKQRLAAYTGFPAPFGQSRFALARGNAFEAQLKAEGAAQLLTLLREQLDLPAGQAHYADIGDAGGSDSPQLRLARTRTLLTGSGPRGTMFDHPMLRLAVGGRHACLEPDLLALRLGGRFHVESGHAEPIRTVRHVHISDRPLVFIPLALAGEANAPLAAMIGDSPSSPAMLIVAEPRDRMERFAFTAELAGLLLKYIDSCDADDAPQILVPSPAAVAFTRLLGRSTRFRRTTGEYAVPASVPLLGRWLSFYAERGEHPASSLLLSATGMLAGHWATGQSATEDLNLGALLAWIDPLPGMTGAEAALLAEDPVRYPPAGPATDPTFDNEVLEPCVNAVRTARLTGRSLDRAVAELTDVLRSQLVPAWELMWRAVGSMRGLSPGRHVGSRWQKDVTAFAWHANHIREGGPPQARRDGAVAAARRLAAVTRHRSASPGIRTCRAARRRQTSARWYWELPRSGRSPGRTGCGHGRSSTRPIRCARTSCCAWRASSSGR